MRDKKFFSKITSVHVAIMLCWLLVCVMTVIWVTHNHTETIAESETPLGGTSAIMNGDEMIVKIGRAHV